MLSMQKEVESPRKYVKVSYSVNDTAERIREEHGLNDKQQWILFNAGILALRDLTPEARERYITEAMSLDRLGGRPLVERSKKNR